MAKYLLQKGDLFELCNGHEVNYSLPSDFPKSDVVIGQIYHVYEPMTEKDVGFDPNYFEREYAKQFDPDYKGFRGIIGLCVGKTHKIVKSYDTSHLAGTYVVLHAEWQGGGSQSCLSGTESFPAGYKVYCRQVVNGNVVGSDVSFYQNNCYPTIDEDFNVIGHREIVYFLKD